MIGCIQYRNTNDGWVHILEMAKDGSTYFVPGRSAISTADAPNFTFDFVPRYGGDHEFCAIKTKNTTRDKVEIFVLSRSSNYRSFIHHAETPFYVSDAPNFDFLMGKGSGRLIGVKRRNTDSGKVEVHVASHLSGYEQFSLHAATPIPLSDNDKFDFAGGLGLDGDTVVALKRANADSGYVEAHILEPDAKEWLGHFITGISLSSVPGRTWLYEPSPWGSEVVGVTNGPTASGFVEIMRSLIVKAGGFPAPPSKYKSVLDTSQIGDFVFKMIGAGYRIGGGGGFISA